MPSAVFGSSLILWDPISMADNIFWIAAANENKARAYKQLWKGGQRN